MSNDSYLKSIGKRVQSLRRQRGLTLEQLSAEADVSSSLLSQLERGLGNPSLETLKRISMGLKVPITSFLDGVDVTGPLVVKKSDRRKLDFPEQGVSYELLTPDLNRSLEMVWVEFEPGAESGERPWSHQGEESGVVLQGVLEVRVDDEVYILRAGDAISFQSTTPHWYRNIGKDKVIAVWAITPPSF